ncbi:hypothetical protein [Paraflavitalea speifideaquila]|nr:hypothetical protein [Paraflavitalea speifideiaquila]
MRQQAVIVQQGNNQHSLTTGKLKAGFYSVTIRLQTGRTASQKLLVTE